MEAVEHVLIGFAVGGGVWFLTWGLNRVYLTFKQFVS